MDKAAAFVISTASAIALVRVLVEVGVAVPEKLPRIILPLALEFTIMAALCNGLFYGIDKRDGEGMHGPENPARFKTALVFGLLYGPTLLKKHEK